LEYYWRWKVSHLLRSAPPAVDMHRSSVRTASEQGSFALPAVWRPTGVPHSIDHSCGLQHTILRSPCIHSDLYYSLGIMVDHVLRLLRYSHILYSNICLCSYYVRELELQTSPIPISAEVGMSDLDGPLHYNRSRNLRNLRRLIDSSPHPEGHHSRKAHHLLRRSPTHCLTIRNCH